MRCQSLCSEAHFYITKRVHFIAERRRQQRRKK